jgi:hypothetical protein
MQISDISSISSIINNLPTNTDNLLIGIGDVTKTHFLENILTNLPSGLKQIKFIYKQKTFSNIKTIESSPKFNVLFGVKIPLNCSIVVNYENVDYDVKYNEFGKELELVSRINQTFKIQYVSSPMYVPVDFWMNTNPSMALPLVALQYSDIKLEIKFEQKKNLFNL